MKGTSGGASVSAALFASSDRNYWSHCLRSYDKGIAQVSAGKKQRSTETDLETLDNWLRSGWPGDGTSFGLSKSSLDKVAQWKLTRGKWRPLLPKIRGNSEAAVKKKSWSAAMEALDKALLLLLVLLLQSWHCHQDLMVLDLPQLRLCSSQVLAPCFEDVPFMSDEALDAAGCPRKYDIKTYGIFAARLVEKAASLGKGWTAEKVGRALWACSVLMISKEGMQGSASESQTRSFKRPSSEGLPPSKRPATAHGT